MTPKEALQDARDGEALRLLREALPDDNFMDLTPEGKGWIVRVYAMGGPIVASAIGDTIAEAADACRAQIEKDGAR